MIALCCLLMTTMSFAQGNGQWQRHEFSPERYKQKLEEFVTHEAGLTPEEAQRLFPMLHEMLAKQLHNNNAQREAMRSCGENASEADYEKAIKQTLALDVENSRLEQDYYKKFHSVISWKKIHAVRMALWKFQMEALRRFTPHTGNGAQRERHQGQQRPWYRPATGRKN